MFIDLAVIDWIALAFAAVLLAGAVAAGVLAYVTSAHRARPSLSMLRSRSASTSASAEQAVDSPSTKHAASENHDVAKQQQVDIDLTSEQHAGAEHAMPETQTPAHAADRPTDADLRLAERAARLRGRPIPESKPANDPLEHRARVRHAGERRTPAHAGALVPPPIPLRGGVSVEHGNFDKAAGFKARNPGFFDDPMGRHELRYWDGHTWTEYVKEHGERFTDPL